MAHVLKGGFDPALRQFGPGTVLTVRSSTWPPAAAYRSTDAREATTPVEPFEISV